MKILAMERELPGARSEQFAAYSRSEAAKVWELHQAGVIREMYYRQDRSEAVLVLECAGAEEARQALDQLPLAQAGLIAFDIIPLVPYPGLARLFADGI